MFRMAEDAEYDICKLIKCMLNTLFSGCKQHQFVQKSKQFDLEAFDSGTLVDSALTIYPRVSHTGSSASLGSHRAVLWEPQADSFTR